MGGVISPRSNREMKEDSSVEQLAFKDGAKIVLKASMVTAEVIEVAQKVGSRALLVLCDPANEVADLHTVKAQPNQRDLLEGAEPMGKTERELAHERGEEVEVITTVVDDTVTHEHPSFDAGTISHTVGLSCLVCDARERGIAAKLEEPEGAES